MHHSASEPITPSLLTQGLRNAPLIRSVPVACCLHCWCLRPHLSVGRPTAMASNRIYLPPPTHPSSLAWCCFTYRFLPPWFFTLNTCMLWSYLFASQHPAFSWLWLRACYQLFRKCFVGETGWSQSSVLAFWYSIFSVFAQTVFTCCAICLGSCTYCRFVF